ncbi:MAG: peptidoglycan DD-metalloendopeptidase family protein, partial [Magnetococcales bacterium]|nr:peptidoglycan DD-metalloendopeptidase family protein [Magnetococcales bacterium]
MNFTSAMNLMLPPRDGKTPHITGWWDEPRKDKPNHKGIDFNYDMGGAQPQSGLNVSHPKIYSPVFGKVIYAGGQYHTIKIIDAFGYTHEILHTQSMLVNVGDFVAPGDAIGTMGGWGKKGEQTYPQHVHYQLKDPRGVVINPSLLWDDEDLSSESGDNAGGGENGAATGGGGGSANGSGTVPDVGAGGGVGVGSTATTQNSPDNDGGVGGDGGGLGSSGGPGKSGSQDGRQATTPARRDPLVLDLDGDGIETTSADGVQVTLFDHDANGIRTGTGWVKSDDGFLVLDRDGNGSIDSGRELFGVDTLKSNGQLAQSGFDALADQDGNLDGKIDASDAIFASLRIWRDLNQDGISQANELTSLEANNILSIGVVGTSVQTNLGNGNIQTAVGTFTRVDSSSGGSGVTVGAIGNLNLVVNTFHREYSNKVPLTAQAWSLPFLRGSGRVRDLSEAISLSPQLGNLVQSYTQETARQGQIDLLDSFIEQWADTSDMPSLKAQAEALSGSGVSLSYILAGIPAGTAAYNDFVRKIGVVERFMGFTYAGISGQARTTPIDSSAGNFTVTLASEQIVNICQAYDAFKADIYESLLLVTRLKPFMDALDESLMSEELLPGVGGSWFSSIETAFEQSIAANPKQGIIDLVEFISSYGYNNLADLGWRSLNFLIVQINNHPDLGAFSEELSSWSVRFAATTQQSLAGGARPDLLVGTSGNDSLSGSQGNDLLVAQSGNDSIYGGEGNDILVGGDGNDALYGDSGNDTLRGGAGNDTLNGSTGNNLYLFGRGDGQDTIQATFDTTPGRFNVLEFKEGVAPADLLMKQVYDANDYGYAILEVTIAGTTDKVSIKSFFKNNDPTNSYNPIQQFRFSDGTTWDLAAIQSYLFGGSALADWIFGTTSAETLNGQAGADYLVGRGGNDILIGGADDDQLNGEDGDDTLQGDAGNDLFYGGTGHDTLLGGDGNDQLNGDSGNDSLTGGAGNDTLQGGDGADIFEGGLGNDTFTGGTGNNLYLFGRGDGQDVIQASYDVTPGRINTLEFKAGVVPADLLMKQVYDASDYGYAILEVSIAGTTDKVSIKSFFKNN